MVPLGHGESERRGRRCARTERVEEGPEEVTPVVGRVELVGLEVVQTGFLVGSFSLGYQTLLLAAAAAVVAAAAAGNGVRLGHVLQHLTSGRFVGSGLCFQTFVPSPSV